jgi:hypothetical protein
MIGSGVGSNVGMKLGFGVLNCDRLGSWVGSQVGSNVGMKLGFGVTFAGMHLVWAAFTVVPAEQ